MHTYIYIYIYTYIHTYIYIYIYIYTYTPRAVSRGGVRGLRLASARRASPGSKVRVLNVLPDLGKGRLGQTR